MIDYSDNTSSNPSSSWRNDIVELVDPFYAMAFTLECLFKIIGMGFVFERGAYLQDPWNYLDFFVVVSGILSVYIPNVTILRTFRILRPLRSLNRFEGVKHLVVGLLKSIPELLNVLVLLGFLFLLFSTFALQLWSGALHSRCRLTPFPIALSSPNEIFPISEAYMDQVLANPEAFRCRDLATNEPIPVNNPDASRDTSPWFIPRLCFWPVDRRDSASSIGICKLGSENACPGTCGSNFDEYGNARFTHANADEALKQLYAPIHEESLLWGFANFDHVGTAYLTIFQCITMEGWVDVMYMLQDAGYGASAAVYFTLLIILGAFFMMNLALAVIWDNFANATAIDVVVDIQAPGQAQAQQRRSLISRITSRKINQDKSINTQRPKVQNVCTTIIESRYFNTTVVILILINTVMLSLDKYPVDRDVNEYVELSNLIMTILFTLESGCKLVGLGRHEWSNDRFNLFDAFIVVISFVELSLLNPEGRSSGALSSLRTFRLLRVFKLARSWTSLQELLVTMIKTVGEIGNFGILLSLFVYIYSLLGMQLFATRYRFDAEHYPVLPTEDGIVPRSNFDTLLQAFVTIFQILTGENWNSIMYDGWQACGWPAVLYFVSLVVLGNFVVLNLFLAILISQFQTDPEDLDNGRDKKNNKDLGPLVRGVKHVAKSVSKLNKLAKVIPKRDPMGHTEVLESEDLRLPPGRSLYLFSRSHAFRKQVANVVLSPIFENVILFCICCSSIFLALDNPLLDPTDPLVRALSWTDLVFTAIFICEMLMKVVVYGFIGHHRSYLRSGWNVLDFTVVSVSVIIQVTGNNVSLRSIRSVRTLKCLRPLRMIARAPGLKLVVNTLIGSIPSILNVLMVCLLFFMIFSLLGVNYFKGRFYACDLGHLPPQVQSWIQDPPSNLNATHHATFQKFASSVYLSDLESNNSTSFTLTSKRLCAYANAQWHKTIDQEFNNVLSGILTLFEMSTTEQWVDVMHAGMDATDIDMQPRVNNSPIWALFFIMYMIFGSFFLTQLFVGVVIDNFNKLKREGGHDVLLTSSQREWVRMHQSLVMIHPKPKIVPPKSGLRRVCHDLAHNPDVELLIATLLLLNTAMMSMTYFGQSDAYSEAVSMTNAVFYVIFLIEIVVKLVGLDPKSFWSSPWNVFDCVIIAGATAGRVLEATSGNASLGSVANVVRTFRVGRVCRLIKTAPTIHALFNTLLMTLPSLANIGTLLFLMYFMYSIIGMQLFAKIALGETLNEHANFQTFGQAMLTLIRASTGENWNGLMYDCLRRQDGCVEDPEYDAHMCGFARRDEPSSSSSSSMTCTPLNGCGTPLSVWYFVSFTMMITFTLLNVFIAVILEGFSEEKELGKCALTNEECTALRNAWVNFDRKATCFMDVKHLHPFFQSLEPPLGFGREYKASRLEVRAFLRELDIPVYARQRVFYGDVIQRLAKYVVQQALGEEIEETSCLGVMREGRKIVGARATVGVSEFKTAHLNSATTIHSAYKNLCFRRQLRQKVLDFAQGRREARVASSSPVMFEPMIEEDEDEDEEF